MKYIRTSLVVNILLISIAVDISYHAAKMIRNMIFARVQSADMIKKIGQLEQKKQELEAKFAEMQTPQAIEREAKERLNLKNQGEEVVVVLPEKTATSTSTSSQNFWQTIRLFFGTKQ